MDEASLVTVSWQFRDAPLSPIAVAGFGIVAGRLGRRLLDMTEESWAGLKGVGGNELLIVTGNPEALPWVDGVVYLGRDEAAPSLLIPTTLEPVFPLGLFERALKRRFVDRSPLAVLPELQLVAPLDLARPLGPESLREWVATQGEV